MPNNPVPPTRKVSDAALALPVRRALLGQRPLPTQRFKRVSSGQARPLGILPELVADAGCASLPAALRLIADEVQAEESRSGRAILALPLGLKRAA